MYIVYYNTLLQYGKIYDVFYSDIDEKIKPLDKKPTYIYHILYHLLLMHFKLITRQQRYTLSISVTAITINGIIIAIFFVESIRLLLSTYYLCKYLGLFNSESSWVTRGHSPFM